MPPDSTTRPWTKAISPARDRLQSRILVGIVVPILFTLGLNVIRLSALNYTSWHAYFFKALGISVAFGLLAYLLKVATPAAAASGSIICFLLTVYTGFLTGSPFHSALTPLIALFLLTSVATKMGRKQKVKRGLAENARGRGAAQIIANLGFAGLISSPAIQIAIDSASHSPGISPMDSHQAAWILILAALAEATADTVSSEIGQAYGKRPFLLTTLRRVELGTDGAISLIGTVGGIFTAAVVTIVGAWSMHLWIYRPQLFVAFAAGIAGLFFDSLLGATTERKGWLGNDLVNFSSTAFAAVVALAAIRLLH